MKVRELIDFLSDFPDDDEIEIEIYGTVTGQYIDTTAAVAFTNVEETLGPVLQIDIEAGKLQKFL